MFYTDPTGDALATITYGSHLYGTNTPASDFDFKVISLPSLKRMLMGKKLEVLRFRFDAEGNPVGESSAMPANGWEAEHTPVQKFVQDYLSGQAYAVEFAYAMNSGVYKKHMPNKTNARAYDTFRFARLCRDLTALKHKSVQGMTGFAMKQTFDYVRRGERYTAACNVLDCVTTMLQNADPKAGTIRLDTLYSPSGVLQVQTVLDEIAKQTGVQLGSSVNNNKTQRTLKLNGREYLETTTLEHLKTAVTKLADQYGVRSTAASETDVDWKSLMHATRVYEQVLELLKTGEIMFPRPNATLLLSIKQAKFSIERVEELLGDLDDQVFTAVENSTLPTGDALRYQAEDLLLEFLEDVYRVTVA